MKIYISEKEIQEKELDMKQHQKHEVVITKWVVASDLGNVNDSEEYCVDIKSLEQHEEEIRKPLEDEIKRFKEDNKDLQEQADTFYEDYCDAVKCIGIAKKEERQKVIAELEEWCENKKITIMRQDIIKTETLDILKLEDLKQKLNQMKEV